MPAPSPAPPAAPRRVVDGLVFPEGPRWHDGRLWFSDIHGHRVMATYPDGATETVAVLDQPSGLGFLPDGTLLAVSMRRRAVMRVEATTVRVHADLADLPGDFANDMVVSPADGQAYVGCRTHRRSGRPPSADCLALVHPDGSVEVAAGDLVGPNGAAITPDGTTLILAETHAHRITAFDRGPDGKLSRRRVFAQLPPKTFPDGLGLDERGAVWIGTGFGQRFLRVEEGGQVTDEIALPDRWAVACVLGGPQRRTLYLATAETTLEGLSAVHDAPADPPDIRAHVDWARERCRGWIEALTVPVAGAGVP